MAINYEIRLKLKDLREDNDLTIIGISNILNVSRSAYEHWENNYNDIPLIEINKIANYYHTTVDYLLGLSLNHKYIKETLNVDYDKLSSRLRILRSEKNLTQKQLGEKIGFFQKTYSNYEIGINKPTAKKLLAIAIFHNVSVDYLMGRCDNPKISKINSRRTSKV